MSFSAGPKASAIVVMGVCGSGKSTVASALADALQLRMLDGDDLHEPLSVEKMRSGIPLEDADRLPWLDRVGSYLAAFDAQFIDHIDPFTLASKVEDPDKNARAFIAPLFSALCADRRDELARAWDAIRLHPAYPRDRTLVTAADVDDPTLKSMLQAFDAMPMIDGPDGSKHDLGSRKDRGEIRDGWLKGKWKDARLWPDDASSADQLRQRLGEFYHDSYARIGAMGRGERTAKVDD
jgi:Mrp family chromosome partitioning ATPase